MFKPVDYWEFELCDCGNASIHGYIKKNGAHVAFEYKDGSSSVFPFFGLDVAEEVLTDMVMFDFIPPEEKVLLLAAMRASGIPKKSPQNSQ